MPAVTQGSGRSAYKPQLPSKGPTNKGAPGGGSGGGGNRPAPPTPDAGEGGYNPTYAQDFLNQTQGVGTSPDIIPDPAVYEAETAAALKAYQNALSSISARRAATLQNYGFTASVDPTTGQLQNYAIDPNNRYGQLQTLLGTQGTAMDAAEHNAVLRGLGNTGLGAQAADQLHVQQGGQTAALGAQFVGEIGQEASDQLGAAQTYNTATVQAQRDALMSAIAQGLFTPAALGGGDSGSWTNPPPTGPPNPNPNIAAPHPMTSLPQGPPAIAMKALAAAQKSNQLAVRRNVTGNVLTRGATNTWSGRPAAQNNTSVVRGI